MASGTKNLVRPELSGPITAQNPNGSSIFQNRRDGVRRQSCCTNATAPGHINGILHFLHARIGFRCCIFLPVPIGTSCWLRHRHHDILAFHLWQPFPKRQRVLEFRQSDHFPFYCLPLGGWTPGQLRSCNGLRPWVGHIDM